MKEQRKRNIVPFSRQERINHALLLFSGFLGQPGLASGQTGIALYLYYFSRYAGDPLYAEFAEELLDDVSDALHTGMPVDFLYGTTGIGWAVDHLIRNGFVSGNRDEILAAFDDMIERQLHVTAGSVSVWTGALVYYDARMQKKERRDKDVIARLERGKTRAVYELSRMIDEQGVRLPGSEFDFAYPYVWILHILEKTIGRGAEERMAGRLREKIREKLERLITGPLDPCNRWLLCRVLQRDDGDFPPLPDSLAVKNGRAGMVLAASLFVSGKSFIEHEIDLSGTGRDNNRHAGYPLPNLPEPERFGLLNGIAGIGLALLVQQHVGRGL